MKPKVLIICAIIFAVLTIALAWIGSSERFDTTIPWFITSAPSVFFFLFILLPYAIKEEKNKKDNQ